MITIRITDIPAQGLEVNDVLSIDLLNQRMNEAPDNDIVFTGAAPFSLKIKPEIGGAELRGTISASFMQPCARCTELTSQSISQDIRLTLQDLKGLVVIDEIQLVPELFPLLRVLGDRHNADTQFLILGSASRDLIRQSSETLAGRIAYRELFPLSLSEIDNTASIAIDRSS